MQRLALPAPLKWRVAYKVLRSSGTRFVSHKVAASRWVLERFGAYLNHLCSLTHDAYVKSVDKQKLTGYIRHWRDAKVLVGCAFISDLLKPAAILCEVLEKNEMCILSTVETILKTKNLLKKLRPLPLMTFPL